MAIVLPSTKPFALPVMWLVLGCFVGIGGTLGASVAQAGCGDYVYVRDAQGQLVRAGSHGHCSGPGCVAGNQINPNEIVHPANERPGRPCQGPHCQQRPVVPVPTPSVPVSPVLEKHVVLAASAGDNNLSLLAGRLDTENSLPVSSACLADIFHPPRCT